MQYTLSLTTRMMTIAGLCLLLLCVLLFLLGVEIGKKMSTPTTGAVSPAAMTAAPPSPLASPTDLPAVPGAAKP